MRADVTARDLDLAAAVTAGPAFWGWTPGDGVDRAALLVAGLLAAAAAASTSAAALERGAAVTTTAAVVGAVWAAAALWCATAWRLGGRIPSLAVVVCTRLLCLVVLVGLHGAAHGGQLDLLDLWPLGLAIGLDAHVTLHTLGVRVTPRRVLPLLLLSTAHAGVVLTLVALALLRPAGLTPRALLSLHVGVLGNVLLAVAAVAAVQRVRAEVGRTAEADRAEEARRRANWIHDEVCGALIPVRQAVRSGRLRDPERIAAELDDVDFTLRGVQLDLLGRHTPLSLADLVQLWGRRVQAAGIRLEPPSWEVAGAILDDTARHRASRLLGVAVPNAIAAGAGCIAVEAAPLAHGGLGLAVSDDAGGFDVDDLPPGRGLQRLADELGPALAITRTGTGTRVAVDLHDDAAGTGGTGAPARPSTPAPLPTPTGGTP